ncbi:hypothetical protein C8J55DRAFT_196115 [Lentinula edodes]|uniref:Uncharacterized protein n=1 Tax=Lentinula lateritia TaxID=40482 RepID=A0A9W8ZX99_9AGAR|nr:hypothetical protein C8J55DRAFT_196115 [Lentinula edodes]
MSTNAKDPTSSRPYGPFASSTPSSRFSHSQPGARKQDFQNRHRHVFEQPRSPNDQFFLSNRRQTFPMSYSQKSPSSAIGDDFVRRRHPRSTHLPTPRIPFPAKTLPSGNYWQRDRASSPPNISSFAKRTKRGTVAVGIDNVRRRTLLAKSGAHYRKAIRKHTPQQSGGIWMDKDGRLRNPDSDSDGMDLDPPSSPVNNSDEDIIQPKLSARKTSAAALPRGHIIISSDEGNTVEELNVDQEESVPDSESESESEEDSRDSDVDVIGDSIGIESMPVPSSALIQAIKPFLPQLPPRNLPFLRRNLRTAFKKSFQTSHAGSPLDKVVLRVLLRATSDQSRWSFSLDSWSCPLCHILGRLDSRQMLDSHIQWYHPGVEILWLKEKEHEWRLILSFPVPSTSHTGRPIAPFFPYASAREAVRVDTTVQEVQGVPGNQSITSLTLENELDSDDDAVVNVRMSPATPVPDTPTPAMSPPILDLSSPSLASITFSPFRGRSVTFAEEAPPSTLDSRYPPPPPANDPLGPAAQRPYLPATSDDGRIVIQYSCRSGGPYLYDLLGLLPLDEFGVLSWLVLDREAEIFENEDISDEWKVMHALWGRWLMMNRRRFIQDYLVGTIDFVDQHWMMIHRAAGWSALRYWLVMLMANRYLQASGVAQVLKHYEEKTGMKYWYKTHM